MGISWKEAKQLGLVTDADERQAKLAPQAARVQPVCRPPSDWRADVHAALVAKWPGEVQRVYWGDELGRFIEWALMHSKVAIAVDAWGLTHDDITAWAEASGWHMVHISTDGYEPEAGRQLAITSLIERIRTLMEA